MKAIRVTILTFLVSQLYYHHAFALTEDCAFCKKDHRSICEGECLDKSEQYAPLDACQPKCIEVKCRSACKEKVKPGDEKSEKTLGLEHSQSQKNNLEAIKE